MAEAAASNPNNIFVVLFSAKVDVDIYSTVDATGNVRLCIV